MRHAVEVRHDSFVDPAFIALLHFVYMRLHGATELYKSRYTGEQLDRWTHCIRAWSQGGRPAGARLISSDAPPRRSSRDVYCYFDTTDKLHAPDNARELMARLGIR